MKILYLTEARDTIGGGVRATRNLAKVLKDNYSELEIAIFGPTNDLKRVINNNIVYFSNDQIKPISKLFYNKLKDTIDCFKPDIVHAMGLYTGTLAQIVRKSRKLFSLIITVHRTTYRPRFYPLSKLPAKWLSSKVDYATFLTEYQANHYKKVLAFSPVSSAIIPNVIPRKEINLEFANKLRKELLAKTNSKYLVAYAGRLIPSKQIQMILETIAVLRNNNLPFGAVIVGDGPLKYKEKLYELVNKLSINRFTIFTGFKTNPEEYLAASDVVLFPTQREALPNLLIESYMLGKPVVTSNIDAIQSLVSHNNAMASYSHDPNSYAETIVELLENRNLYNLICSNAKNAYDQNYDPVIVANKYMKIYSKLLSKQRL